MELTPQAKEIVEIYKALCRAHDVPPPLSVLNRVYYQLEGRDAPFTGFASVEELLRASNEFQFHQVDNDLYVSVKLIRNIAHFVEMIVANRRKTRRLLPPAMSQPNTVLSQPQQLTKNVTSVVGTKSPSDIPPPLNLPWDKKHWFVHVHTVKSLTSIIVQLATPKYSEKIHKLYVDIAKSKLQVIKGPPIVGRHYIIKVDGYFNRAICDHVDTADRIAQCTCIDFVKEVWMKWSDIYECEIKFLQLPAQFFRTSLYGLERFLLSKEVISILRSCLEGRCFVCEPKISREMFEKAKRALIPMVFFLTPSSEKININQVLLNEVLKFEITQLS